MHTYMHTYIHTHTCTQKDEAARAEAFAAKVEDCRKTMQLIHQGDSDAAPGNMCMCIVNVCIMYVCMYRQHIFSMTTMQLTHQCDSNAAPGNMCMCIVNVCVYVCIIKTTQMQPQVICACVL